MSGTNVKLLEKLLDYSQFRHKVISNNIANVGTANYQRKDVSFKDALSTEVAKGMKSTNEKHITSNVLHGDSEGEFVVYNDTDTRNKSGINNVDANHEMAEMAQNTLMFKFGAKKLNGYFNTIQELIRGTR